MDEQPSRKRRIIKRIVLAVVGSVLLPVCYIGSIATFSCLSIGQDSIPDNGR